MTSTTGIAPSPASSISRRISEWVEGLHLRVASIAERPDAVDGEIVYVIKDVFTTRGGAWEVNGQPCCVPQWAKDSYLTSGGFAKAYERRNLYAAVLGLDGQFIVGQEILFWPGGLEKLNDLGSVPYALKNTVEPPGWAVIDMAGSSSYNAQAGERGPWCWTLNKPLAAEVMVGGGLPNGEDVSTFVVWQAVRKSELDDSTRTPPTPEPPTPEPPTPEPPTPEPPTPEPPTPEPPTPEPPTPEPPIPPPPPPPPPPQPLPIIARRSGSWIGTLNLQVKMLEERPDTPPSGEYVYLVKDIFTTRDGSWDPSSVYGSVDQWAREAYLKPFSDPEYFDDAGADHHLFAAILDKDGKLLKNIDVLYWSDGFDRLGDPTYNGYAVGSNGFRYPRTKERSGWANIALSGGSSYVPERGETGPWCWTPYGLPAEVVVGGGMPAKQHVSVFVVWQAVSRPAVITPPTPPTPVTPVTPVTPPTPVTGDFRIYLPTVMRDALPEGAPPGLADNLRAGASRALGFDYQPSGPLAVYARQVGLAAPLSAVFEVSGYMAQAFYGGIVFAPAGEPNKVSHIAW